MKKKVKYLKNIKREIIIYLNEYIKFGGYPRVVIEEDIDEKIFILKELYTSFLKKRHFRVWYKKMKLLSLSYLKFLLIKLAHLSTQMNSQEH